jgi:hypothetical protein
MSLWGWIPVEALIAKNVPPYGLAPRKWLEQAEEIRRLPETDEPIDETRDA